jgi:hypothetical protein
VFGTHPMPIAAMRRHAHRFLPRGVEAVRQPIELP